ncbi:MAG: Bax inhibitor-1 family protein [Eubacterium sp.]|nr:Bax inhibitor-1 family protein [Eubacterium sp.]
MELKKDNQNNGQTNYSQPQNPYGQPQNPYGQPQNPFGQPQNPYGQQPNYGQPQNSFDAFDSLQNQAVFNQGMSQTMLNGYYQNNDQPGDGIGGAVAQVSASLVNSVLTTAFLYMFIALLVTGITALIVAANPAFYMAILGAGKFGLIMIFIVEIALVFACTAAIKKDNFVVAVVLFTAFTIVNGITFSVIFLAFTLSSIVQVFFMTSLIFGVMAIYGAVTKKDLTSWGPILLGALIAIIVGSIINIFIGSSAVDFIVTIVGIIVFTLFTAYDVNKISKMSRMNTGLSVPVLGLYGAMELYLDFINLFLKLLRLFGKRK